MEPGKPHNRGIGEEITSEMVQAENQRKQLRLNHNIFLLGQGNIATLHNDEFVFALADCLTEQKTADLIDKRSLIKNLGRGSSSDDLTLRERSLMVLTLAAEKFLVAGNKEHIAAIAGVLSEWLRLEEDLLSGHAVIIKRIEELSVWLILNKCLVKALDITRVIAQIQTGILKKSKAIASLIASAQVRLADKQIVNELTDNYLRTGRNQETCKKILISLGPKAVVHLLTRINNSQSKQEGELLRNLVSCFGESSIPVLTGLLEKNSPSSVIQNVLRIMSKLKEPVLYEYVCKYFEHEDIQVQHEAICYVLQSGNDADNSRLVEALEKVDDSLKGKIIRQLAETGESSKSIATVLCKLAREKQNLLSTDENGLLKTIIVALRKYPFKESFQILKMVQSVCHNRSDTEELLVQITESLRTIEPEIRHKLQSSGVERNITFDNDPARQQKALTKVRKVDEKIKKMIMKGDLEAAGQFVYDESIGAARAKDFLVAELLRDRMLEVNPMALTDVLQLGDAIDLEKDNPVTSEYLHIWKDLNKEMGQEKFNVLYAGLRQAHYDKNEIIVRNGEIDASLYFINAGDIGLSVNYGQNETFLKRIQPGHILGSEQFFSASVWTTTLKAVSAVEMQILDRAVLDRMNKGFPEIEGILQKYCERCDKTADLLKMTGDDRREFPRYPTTRFIQNVLHDPYGEKGKRNFRGELIELSEGGLSFIIRVSSKKNARSMLGRQIISTLPPGIECSGIIVGIRALDSVQQDFSVHVKFLKNIGAKDLEMLVGLCL